MREITRICLFISALSVSSMAISCRYSDKQADTLIITFAGDLLLDRGVRESIEHLGPDPLFHPSIDSVFSRSDIVVANLECPATTIEEPINKRFIFRAEPEWLNTLKKHGITHLNLANNHSMDQGRSGLIDTKSNLQQYGLIPMGFGDNVEEACRPILIATNPRNIYVLSSVQVPSENWTYLENEPCVCEASVDAIIAQIEGLKHSEVNAVIIVSLHWGAEHTLSPLTSQKQQAHELIDAGADCIIGHHTHTVQSIEHYKGKPIYYSIGNFIFDQSKPINSKGLLVSMIISPSAIQFRNLHFDIVHCVPRLSSDQKD